VTLALREKSVITKMLRAVTREAGGAVMVEMALLCPVILGLIAGVIDLGLMLQQRTVVETAADAGALYAAIFANPTVPINSSYQSSIQQAVTQSNTTSFGFATAIQASPAPSTQCGCPTATFSINSATCGATCPLSGLPAGTYAIVSAQSSYTPLLPWPVIMSGGAVSMTAQSWVRIQ
jgi:Flp pilus assembly protein TadG